MPLSLLRSGYDITFLLLDQFTFLNFLIELSKQIYTRFPFNDDHMRGLSYTEFLEPFSEQNLVATACAFLKVDTEEYQRYRRDYANRLNPKLSILEHWYRVKCDRKGDETPEYPLLIELVEYIFVLPHSSAACERVFSAVNENKPKKRNKLVTRTLNGMLLGKTCLNLNGEVCYTFKCTTKMHQYFNKDMYADVDVDNSQTLSWNKTTSKPN